LIISKSAGKSDIYYFNEPHSGDGIDLEVKQFENIDELAEICISFVDEESGMNDEFLEACSGHDDKLNLKNAVDILNENSAFYLAVDCTYAQFRYNYYGAFGDLDGVTENDFKYIDAGRYVPDALKGVYISGGVFFGLRDLGGDWLLPYVCAMARWLAEKTYEDIFSWQLYFIFRDNFCRIIAENTHSGNNYFPSMFEKESDFDNNFIARIESGEKNRVNIFLQREE